MSQFLILMLLVRYIFHAVLSFLKKMLDFLDIVFPKEPLDSIGVSQFTLISNEHFFTLFFVPKLLVIRTPSLVGIWGGAYSDKIITMLQNSDFITY